MLLMDTEDLKDEILGLKRRLNTVTSENYLLKVKIRKLQTEIDKKDKQLECLLDPSKTNCIRKIISERGATMIINLKQHNNELEEALIAKDILIKKLQLDIKTSKLYLPKDSSSSSSQIKHENRHVPLQYKECNYGSTYNKFRSRSLSATPVPRQSYLKSSSDIQMEYVQLAQNLQKIKNANYASKQRPSSHNVAVKTKNTVENVLAKSSVVCNGNQDVQTYFTNLLDEMEKLKDTVTHLTTEQENTKKFLKDKKNIEMLARKVKHLQKSKFIKKSTCKSESVTVLKPVEAKNSEESCSTNCSYSQESFEDDENSFEKSTKNSQVEENIEQESDDDDVETGDS